MSWKSLRLELARTKEFPNGSPAHAYLLQLPLDDSGIIDEGALGLEPERALVRRSWPDEPVFHLETHRMVPGEYITLTDPDGEQLPFRVVSIRPLGEPSAAGAAGLR